MQQRRSITAMAHMHRKTSEAIDIASGALDAISAYMQQPAQQAAAHEAHEHETPSRPTVGHGAVSDMVQRVQDIANQINLLAVNVTVESARAGAGNKSLANVAAEVRGFAQQTASSAREIATQINQLHDTVAATDAPVVSKKATMVDWYTSAADISVPDIRDWAEQVASLSEEEERLQKKQA
jgi:methyl-accepting chemotaxis protein